MHRAARAAPCPDWLCNIKRNPSWQTVSSAMTRFYQGKGPVEGPPGRLNLSNFADFVGDYNAKDWPIINCWLISDRADSQTRALGIVGIYTYIVFSMRQHQSLTRCGLCRANLSKKVASINGWRHNVRIVINWWPWNKNNVISHYYGFIQFKKWLVYFIKN